MSEPVVTLRDVCEEDLPIFCEHQMDPAGIQMAAFTPDLPNETAAYMARLKRIHADESATQQTILLDGQVIGGIASFGPPGEREVTYWLGREYWGMGLATRAWLSSLHFVAAPCLLGRPKTISARSACSRSADSSESERKPRSRMLGGGRLRR